MPTYDYLCKDCGHTFEIFQSMSDSAITECPYCNGKVRRIVSGGTGLIFKGSGYYITDYKNGKSSSKEKSGTKKESSNKESTEKEKKEKD